MSIGIIGHTGWIGSYIHRAYPTAVGFNTSNITDIANKEFDLLFICGVSAKKWLANKEPEHDLANIQSLYNALKTIQSIKKCILVSTIDIYSKVLQDKNQDEHHIVPESDEAYGKNRYWFEIEVKKLFPTTLIIRLPALFGFELKKNVIFDFLFRKTCTLDLDSMFQWYDMNWFLTDLKHILDTNKIQESINLFPEPLPNRELMQLLCQYPNRNVIATMGQNRVYDIKTIHTTIHYWKSKHASKASLKRYLDTILSSNILVSNLAMHPLPTELLQDFGVEGKEIVPYKTFGPQFIDLPLQSFETHLVYSMQGLFYPNNWNLRDHFETILTYLKKLVDIAIIIGCHILVFGSPQLRSVGSERFTELLISIDTYIDSFYPTSHVFLCIEPNAKYYKNTFLTTCKETATFVNSLIHSFHVKHIGWMMDIGNMVLEQENILECIQLYAKEIKHVHFSTRDLLPLSTIDNVSFPWIKYQLKKHGYNGKITLEMCNVNYQDLRTSLYAVQTPMKINVIGAGWYGCHITHHLTQDGYNVAIQEKKNIFAGVSSKNQDRLHEAFHYPRSWNTRQLCKRNHKRFMSEYGFCTTPLTKNLYFIANDSLLDMQTYRQIMEAENLPFLQIENNELQLTAPICFQVQERYIDFRLAKDFFQSQLNRILSLIEYITDPTDNKIEDSVDLTLDCTYNAFQKIPHSHFEPSTFWIYQRTDSEKSTPKALTVMDGPFWSLYPHDLKNHLYTLTHVKWGRFQEDKRREVEMDILRYYPSFFDHFTFSHTCFTQKHIMTSECASRELQIYESLQWISVACGKITGIFDFQDYLQL